MGNLKQKCSTVGFPGRPSDDRTSSGTGYTRLLILLIAALCCARPSPAADTDSQKPSGVEVAKQPRYESALDSQMQLPAKKPQAADQDLAPTLALSALCMVFLGYFGFRMLRNFNRRSNRLRAKHAEPASNLLAEDPFAELTASFQSGSDNSSHATADPTVPNVHSGTNNGSPKTDAAALKEFFTAAGKDLAVMRSFISEIGRASEQGARQKLLVGLSGQIGLLKRKSDLPELLPVWQMAFAFEGLLNQLTRNAAEVTASTLLTAENAVSLLELLCKPGLRSDLASNPPVRLLAVDDDLISRNAISAALKKVFDKPDLAPNGKEALALLESKAYDVVFLDVEMPEMDGFELCTRIHGSARNQNTPVVFVTSHSDFDSRAKSMSVGGNDLIAKPFLAFEITLKALTLVLKARLQNTATEAPSRSTELSAPAVKLTPLTSEARASARRSAQFPVSPHVAPSAHALPSPQTGNRNLHDSPESLPNEFAPAFFLNAPVDLQLLRNYLNEARKAPEPSELQETLGILYIGVRSLADNAQQAGLHAIVRAVSSLEGVIKRQLEKPELCAPSAMDSAAAALDLIDELCRARSNPDLANPPPPNHGWRVMSN